MPHKREISVSKGRGNVFTDLGLPDAGDLQIKAELTRQLHHRIKELGLTQVQAAKRLGLKQPDVSKIARGRFTGFSLDRLIALLNALEIDVEIILHRRSGSGKNARKRGIVRIMTDGG